MIIKEDNRIGPAICCVCGKDAKINDSGKWDGGMGREMWYMNIKVYCKKERKNKTHSND